MNRTFIFYIADGAAILKNFVSTSFHFKTMRKKT